jgi:hypothetical protein
MTASTQDPCPSGLDLLERWLDYREAWLATHDVPGAAGQPVRPNQ